MAIIIGFMLIIMQAGRRSFGSSSTRSRTSYQKMLARKPPEALGVPLGHPARSAAERVEAALTADFEARIKDRVFKNKPGLREDQWQWTWFELKRYFLMCAVLRGVPMYSEKVDDVWHEMLMFTREYEEFCRQLCGGFIHHAPHAAGVKPDSGERAWFDWVYGELFARTPDSDRTWGAFYRTPMPGLRMEELERMEREELRRLYFNGKAAEAFTDLNDTIDYLINRGKMLALGARSGKHDEALGSGYRSQWNDPAFMTGALSGALFYSSMLPTDQFHNQMDDAQTKERHESNSSCGSSFVCSSDNNGSGNDGGGSSCGGNTGDGGGGSSCGGGGGGSCGGGGE
ncbi:hypothetical protein KZ483_03190 [Paenibacillus sp. sptzw28]|uniref:glycine-rich domain-containing protein n=1 Tax=Paenibacillus sp. sptzw28 TaxID=715179 RepID=UPI001C6F5C8F|nr:hypothetical protein [Paenibacillus sp. sptzw28]QYR22048.1 hypothetical protein KZ483_03190 [Paenibacillus sp. sptzw28]